MKRSKKRTQHQQQLKSQWSSLPYDTILEILSFVPCYFESIADSANTLTLPQFPFHRTLANKVLSPMKILGSSFIRLYFGKFERLPDKIFFLYGAVEYNTVSSVDMDLVNVIKNHCSVVSLNINLWQGQMLMEHFRDNRELHTFRLQVNSLNLCPFKLPHCTKSLIHKDCIYDDTIAPLLSELPQLRSLDTTLQTFEAVNTICDHSPSLTHLGVNSLTPAISWNSLLVGLSKLRYLNSLKIGVSGSNQDDLVKEIVCHCKQLTSLNIYSINELADLSLLKNMQLKELYLPHTFINYETMKSIQSIKTLTRFSFASSCGTDHENAVKHLLSNSNSNSLKAIKISMKVSSHVTTGVENYLKKCHSVLPADSSLQGIMIVIFYPYYFDLTGKLTFWKSKVSLSVDHIENNLE
jgi:hypothetical protein